MPAYKIVSASYMRDIPYGQEKNFDKFEKLCAEAFQDGFSPLGSPFVIGLDIHQAFRNSGSPDFVGMAEAIVEHEVGHKSVTLPYKLSPEEVREIEDRFGNADLVITGEEKRKRGKK